MRSTSGNTADARGFQMWERGRLLIRRLDRLLEHDLALEHAVHGALGADLHEALALVLGQLLGEVHDHAESVGEPRCAGS